MIHRGKEPGSTLLSFLFGVGRGCIGNQEFGQGTRGPGDGEPVMGFGRARSPSRREYTAL
jgi:hypothetical protein